MENGYPSQEQMDQIMRGARKLRAEEIKRIAGVVRNAIAGLFAAAPGRTAER